METWLDNLITELEGGLSDSLMKDCFPERYIGMKSENWVDPWIVKTLSFSSMEKWLCERDIGMKSEKDIDDPWWFKIREEAKPFVKKWDPSSSVFDDGFLIYDDFLEHNSLESALADRLACKLTKFRYYGWFRNRTVEWKKNTLREVMLCIFTEDAAIRRAIRKDLRAAAECNPVGTKSALHFFLNSRGFLACQAYRVAHKLRSLNKKSMAKKIQNLASKAFGINIHPGARIGSGILIHDHASGVVIGKRAVIRDNATMLVKNSQFCMRNSLALKINDESLSAFTDVESIFIPYVNISKFVNCKKKSSRGVGLAGEFHRKFNNLSPGNGLGGESCEDDGGQFHAIQVHEGDHNSRPSIQLASSALNTWFASNQNDKQPPPDRFPAYIKNGAEIVEEESTFNLSSLAKTFLLISGNICLTASAVGLVAGKSLPKNARILLSSAGVCSLAGFLLCSCGYVFQSSRRAKHSARLMTAGGVVAAMFAFVVMMGTLSIIITPFSILDFNFSV